MSFSSSSPMLTIDPRLYCETINELHSYITSSKRGYLTQAELFRYYRQRHENIEIPYRLLGYRSLIDLLSSDQRLFALDLRREPAYVYSAVKLRQEKGDQRTNSSNCFTRQHHSTTNFDEEKPFRESVNYILFNNRLDFNDQDENIISEDKIHSQIEQTTKDENFIIENHSNKNLCEKDQIELSDKENFQEFSPSINDRSFSELKDKIVDKPESILTQRIVLVEDRKGQKKISSNLSRSISTSTTSLSNSCSFKRVDLYLFISTIVISFIFLVLIFSRIEFR